MRPRHILEMISCRETGSECLAALTGFVSCLLHGKINPEVSPTHFGSNLIALEKRTRGERPTAVGYTLRCIAVSWSLTSFFSTNMAI